MAVDKKREKRLEEQSREAEATRLKELEQLAFREDQVWENVDSLIAGKKSKLYDEAIGLLKGLQALAKHKGNTGEFHKHVTSIKKTYPNRSGLISRINSAQLMDV